jgi:archaellum component FlaC
MNDLLNNRKTRIEALNDRINEADNELNKFLPKENEPENGPGEANLNTQKFINRMENILKDLNSLAFKSNIDNNQIQNEVN